MSDGITSSCCGRTLTSYWHLTYCSPQGNVKVKPKKVVQVNVSDNTLVKQMVLDHDHLPPHLRLQNRMYLETDD